MLGDPQEAEDAVQQTFLAAYSDLISSDKPIHLRAWLFTIARNRCYSLLRGRREQPASDLEEPLTEGLASQVQRRQDLRDLVVDLRQLPDEQRAALVLAELDALSHEEIAIALDVPREKVKALVFQARESLVASRTARETDCTEIREQLATQRGGALRRGNLRRHLRECAGCRDFRREVERQRRQLAALLPVVPTVALKEGVLGATIGGGAAAGVGTGGLVLSTALKSGLAKGALGALLAGAGAATTIVATHGLTVHSSHGASSRHQAAAVASTAGNGAGTTTVASALVAGDATASAPTGGATTAAGSGSARPTVTSSTYATTGSFIRRAALNPFAPLLGIPMPLKGGEAPRRMATVAPTAAPVQPVPASPPSAPVAATPPANMTPVQIPTPGPTSHGSGGHDGGGTGTPSGSGRGDSTGGSGRNGSSGYGHGGGGDNGSGTPVPQRGGTGSTGGGTRGQGSTGNTGTGSTGNTGATGTTGTTGTGTTGSTGTTGTTGTGATGTTGTVPAGSGATVTGTTTGTGTGAADTTSGSTSTSGSSESTTAAGASVATTTATVVPGGTTRGETTATH